MDTEPRAPTMRATDAVEAARTRPRVLLLHGALAAGVQFEALARALSASFDVHAPDLPGHGAQAGDPAPLGMTDMASAMVRYLDANAIDVAPVFGYSMGGYVGLLMARDFPDRVSRVMTLGTILRWDPSFAATQVAKLDPPVLEAKVPAFAAALRERHGEHWPAVVRRTAELMTALGESQPLTLDDLPGIGQPVRLAVGDKDDVVDIEQCQAARSRLRAGEMEVMPGTGHPFERVGTNRLVFSLLEFLA